MTWQKISQAQARALGRIGAKKDAPSGLILGFDDTKNEVLIVVPCSSKDRRRWDIEKGGRIRRVKR